MRSNDIDLDKPIRQQIYLRALRTIPKLEIIEGHFLSHEVMMKNATGSGFTKVIKTEEKGTDVNIVTHLINDAHKKAFDIAVVISNDSDLLEPIKIVVDELLLSVIVVSPVSKNNSQLRSTTSSARNIRAGVLGVSQFPPEITDSVGKFTKPLIC